MATTKRDQEKARAQVKVFRETAREHEADQAEAEFNEALKKVVRHSGFKDGLGRDIPADAFENDPGSPRDPKKTVSKKNLEDFDAETAKLKRRTKKRT